MTVGGGYYCQGFRSCATCCERARTPRCCVDVLADECGVIRPLVVIEDATREREGATFASRRITGGDQGSKNNLFFRPLLPRAIPNSIRQPSHK